MAESVRQKRVAQVITRAISLAMLQEFGATDLSFTTIQRVKISPDLRVATLYYTIFGGQSRQSVALLFDKHNRFFRGKVSQQLKHLRSMPELRFIYDEAADEMMRLEKIFDEAKRERESHNEEE